MAVAFAVGPVPCPWTSFLQLSRTATSRLFTCTGLFVFRVSQSPPFFREHPWQGGRCVPRPGPLQAQFIQCQQCCDWHCREFTRGQTPGEAPAGPWVHLLVFVCASDHAAGPAGPIYRKPHRKGVSGRFLASPVHLDVPTAISALPTPVPLAEVLCMVIWAAPAKDSDGFVNARPGFPAHESVIRVAEDTHT